MRTGTSDDPYGHKIMRDRHALYRYDQASSKCPCCGYDAPAVPLPYTDNEGYARTSNYAKCINPYCIHPINRRYGHSLEEFTIRQWQFTCMLNHRYYRPNENPYHAMNTRYPYPPMTHYCVFGTRD